MSTSDYEHPRIPLDIPAHDVEVCIEVIDNTKLLNTLYRQVGLAGMFQVFQE